jgi:RNA polymerase sigma factor (sigma-70 family)
MPGIRLSTLVRRLRRDTAPGEGCSDADLLARFGRARDDAAFELLVWRHGAMVLGTCQRTLGHTEDAEDAFQATFLVLARKAAGIGYGIALPAWLHRVAVRIAARLAQRRRVGMPLDAETEAPPAPDPVEQAEGLSILDEEINRLPERCRRAVVLCYLEGLTAGDAARLLGCPTGTVESRLATARKTLRDRLTRRGVTLPAGVLAVLAGQATLAPEAVARVVRAGVAFVRDGAAVATGILGKSSVKLAQGVLTMGGMRTRAGLLAVAMAVVASAGVGWADRETPVIVADEPAAKPVVAIAPPPVAKAETPADQRAEKWPLVQRTDNLLGWLKGITPDGKSLIYVDTQILYKRNINNDNIQNIFTGIVYEFNSVTFSSNERFVATVDHDQNRQINGVRLRDARTGKVLDILTPSGGLTPREVAFTPDSSKLIALCEWNINSDIIPKRVSGDNVEGRIVLQFCIWDLATRKEISRPAEFVQYRTVPGPQFRFVAGGRFVLKFEEFFKKAANGKMERDYYGVSLIDPLTGVSGKPAEFRVPGFVPVSTQPDTVSPDGKAMLAVNWDTSEVLVFDTTTGQERLRLGRLPRSVGPIAFSPDGKRIVAATGFEHDKEKCENNKHPPEMRIWDATTGKELARLRDKECDCAYQMIRFSPDGSFLVAQDIGRQTTIWGQLPQPGPVQPVATTPGKPDASAGIPDRFQALIRDLSGKQVTDSRRVEGVFMAALGRLPTDVEAQLLTTQFARQTDKAAAMRDLLSSLVNTAEFKAHIAELQKLAK